MSFKRAPTAKSCPICSQPVTPSARYPRHVCPACDSRAASSDGRRLRFFNDGFSGGYQAEYADTGEPYTSHECYIDGIKCYADEARFGGIVIQVVDETVWNFTWLDRRGAATKEVDTPNPVGLSYAELADALGVLLASGRAAGLEVTIFDPELDPTGEIAAGFATCLARSL